MRTDWHSTIPCAGGWCNDFLPLALPGSRLTHDLPAASVPALALPERRVRVRETLQVGSAHP